ncbi:related to Reduced viability upon starvation protein 167 [Saccharomycodes ludwigii]|uniref:Related to Reduced viability upon starvation protein 167 n=1 Tax=Saccharomycodes ludwigii TaxID=36035 RepID=A0A376B4U6_9ASCO|nr:hypothetical protein SCDLUD_003249 [Saccharomycodes ludwigii]KAH3900277.1 hypothetical protein SCDLUD_003249 [Saccharomycodes ludwigii]SSD59716.1 related to Reduced viability upon starvation protein 167 [Saccharomycodes ludwigii]
MSFKGFTKAITRAPQQFRQKMHMGHVTSDPVYEDAERRFKEIELETKKLSEESKRYSNAVNGMLNHQIGFSKAIEEIYKPISGKMSDPNSTVPEDNPEGIDACVQYREIVADLQKTLKPDLDLIDEKIVKPAQELLRIVNGIRKMATKRAHKQLDLDRRLNTVKKYEEKKEPSAKDEERLYKAQCEVEAAQQEFDYYNDIMKVQLPELFSLQNEFLKPMFVSFYYMQLNIFYTLYTKFQDLQIPYFDLESDILEAFQAKRGNVEEQADALSITHFKLGYSKAKLEMTRRRFGKDSEMASPNSPLSPGYTGLNEEGGYPAAGTAPTYGGAPVYAGAAGTAPQGYPGTAPQGYPGTAPQGYPGTTPQGYPNEKAYYQPQQPAAGALPGYGGIPPATAAAAVTAANPATPQGYPNEKAYYQPQQPAAGAVPGYTGAPAGVAATAAVAPPAYSSPASPSAPAGETCTALYEYQAQAQGDLSFPAGAVIQIIQKTADANEWWTGTYNGQTGVFPGNYVQLNN